MLSRRVFYLLWVSVVVLGVLVVLVWYKPELFYQRSATAYKVTPSFSAQSKSSKLREESSRPHFALDRVLVKGEFPFVSKDKIKLTLSKYIKDDFFDINLDKIIKAMQSLPGVKSVTIRKVWPDKLMVNLVSYKLFAKTQNPGELISVEGKLFATDVKLAQKVPVFISDKKNYSKMINFYNFIKLKLDPIGLQVSKLKFSALGAWEVFVLPQNDQYIIKPQVILLQLGNKLVETRFNKFIEIYKAGVFKDKSYNKKLSTPKILNLQYQSGFSVQWYH